MGIKYFECKIEPSYLRGNHLVLKIKIRTNQEIYQYEKELYPDETYSILDRMWNFAKRELDDFIKTAEPLSEVDVLDELRKAGIVKQE